MIQPRTLALLLTLLPLLTVNGAYLVSALQGHVAWCIPYLDGCTTISQAGRSGDAIFLFRALSMVQAVLLVCFWLLAKQWLDGLYQRQTPIAAVICWLGIIGAVFLMLYIDYIGSEGAFNRFMRRQGVLVYFTFTALAQLLLTSQLHKLRRAVAAVTIDARPVRYQFTILLMMLGIGLVSIVLNYAELKTYASENIVEWNFALLMSLYFAGNVMLWNKFSLRLHTT